ncbi:hypothetical protein SAMN05421827_111185 [Pedobacter terrae]|uniref:Uncharacterized protein n=1 Tax=Pedobacter terrae TaxID=405671 RepID=A0A1G7XEW4_9SPHI|nr:hypothetical protein SAMN05421827_111185 [Pedobacter terrae]
MEDYLSLFPNADAQQWPETDLRGRFFREYTAIAYHCEQ